jgi:hypothetical protein
MTTPRSRSLATALLTARSLAAALPPSYTINRDTTPATPGCGGVGVDFAEPKLELA